MTAPNPCSTCKYYQGLPTGAPVGPGECHVSPPQMVVVTTAGRSAGVFTAPPQPAWPAVNADDWCGQWAAIT